MSSQDAQSVIVAPSGDISQQLMQSRYASSRKLNLAQTNNLDLSSTQTTKGDKMQTYCDIKYYTPLSKYQTGRQFTLQDFDSLQQRTDKHTVNHYHKYRSSSYQKNSNYQLGKSIYDQGLQRRETNSLH